MRFYVPEWEDHVDAAYDFVTDEHSALDRSERELAYIWDVFDRDPDRTPIDGVLISREQIEESPSRVRRLREHGVYDAPDDGTTLSIPDWLPTISDCGAWGYKDLPFPPYSTPEMLEFYEEIDVDIGVTIDHLVLGGGQAGRLYIDERALTDEFALPEALTETVDVMTAEWPDEWPAYVSEYESSIVNDVPTDDLAEVLETFAGIGVDATGRAKRVTDRLEGIADDPRLVYRENDTRFRYELTLDNLRAAREHYDAEEYPFRLMCAIQGWDRSSYADAARVALGEGYQYLGIGGVAGSTQEDVEQTVASVGQVIDDYEQAHETRVDSHVFGFAKTGAFDTVGRSGVASFDSASMLRAAWTGGGNYHLDTADTSRRYDALRVRYPPPGGSLREAIETALWSQEMLHALRAYDRGRAVNDAIREWHESAGDPLETLEPYLGEHRWDSRYEGSRLRDLTERFRTHYRHGARLKANFSGRFRKQIIKLLREDGPEDPVSLKQYTDIVDTAEDVLETFPRSADDRQGVESGSLEDVWPTVERYTEYIGDEPYREGYRELLSDRPWDECGCEVCTSLGIDVAIFRGNNRNRRRGFHNTRNFYDRFEEELPKILVVSSGSVGLSTADTVEEFLENQRPDLWSAVHDLPIAEIGVVTAHGVHEWWERSPSRVSLDPEAMTAELTASCKRYQTVVIDERHWSPPVPRDRLVEVGCTPEVCAGPEAARTAVLERLGYVERMLPPNPDRLAAEQIGITEFDS